MPRKKVESDEDSIADFEDSVLSQLGEDEEEGEDEGEEEIEESGEEEEGEGEEEEEGEGEGEEEEPSLDLRPDKKGNLIDPKTGKIVAPSGSARRFYEDLTRTRQRLNSVEGTLAENRQLMTRAAQVLQEYKAKVDAYEGQANLPNQLGLSPSEHAEALQFAAKFKNNATAVDAIKLILTRAAQRGINMESLGTQPLDLSVITQDINKKIEDSISPLTNRLKASDEQTQAQQRANEEVQGFFNRNPEAKQFAPVLVQMAQKPELQHLPLNEQWLLLQNYLLRQRQQQPGATRTSRPGGRANAGVGANSGPDDAPVTVDSSYRDIVRAVVKDHGGIDF